VGLNNLLIYRQTVVKLFWEFGCFYYYCPGSFLIPAFPDLTFLMRPLIAFSCWTNHQKRLILPVFDKLRPLPGIYPCRVLLLRQPDCLRFGKRHPRQRPLPPGGQKLQGKGLGYFKYPLQRKVRILYELEAQKFDVLVQNPQ